MNLQGTITEYAKSHIGGSNDWYTWAVPKVLPAGMVIPVGSHYEQNVALKNKLHDLYLAGNNEEKEKLIEYYIDVWGGVRRNSDESLTLYALSKAEDLIARGTAGVASWSKALCIRNPDAYAIFDARVSVSLNSLQVIYGTDNPIFFPALPSRNKAIVAGTPRIQKFAESGKWEKAGSKSFYQIYNKLLSEVAQGLESHLMTVEMLLFSKAEELLAAALNQIR